MLFSMYIHSLAFECFNIALYIYVYVIMYVRT